MPKEKIKRKLYRREGLPIPENLTLVDVHRIVPRAEGGTYKDLDNVELIDPVEHAKLENRYVERPETMEEIKMHLDGRKQLMKSKIGMGNRLDAMDRHMDKLDQETYDFIKEQIDVFKKRIAKKDRIIEKLVTSLEDDIPHVKSAMNVFCVGKITVASMLVYIDIEKAPYVSCMWSYTGLDKPSHERYTKGESGGGNINLRTALYQFAESVEKRPFEKYPDSHYNKIYLAEKERLQNSEKYTQTRVTGESKKLIKKKWKDVSDGHRRGASLRKVMKRFLADWWYVERTLKGLPTHQSYRVRELGHDSWIKPKETGWEF